MEYTPHSSIDGLLGIDGQVRVRARKPCSVGYVNLNRGEEMTAMRHEVARLLRHRMVEEVSMPAVVVEAEPVELDTQTIEPVAEAPKRRGGRPRKNGGA